YSLCPPGWSQRPSLGWYKRRNSEPSGRATIALAVMWPSGFSRAKGSSGAARNRRIHASDSASRASAGACAASAASSSRRFTPRILSSRLRTRFDDMRRAVVRTPRLDHFRNWHRPELLTRLPVVSCEEDEITGAREARWVRRTDAGIDVRQHERSR